MDDEFPPTDPSIGSPALSANVMWKRPDSFIEGDIAVFQGSI